MKKYIFIPSFIILAFCLIAWAESDGIIFLIIAVLISLLFALPGRMASAKQYLIIPAIIISTIYFAIDAGVLGIMTGVMAGFIFGLITTGIFKLAKWLFFRKTTHKLELPLAGAIQAILLIGLCQSLFLTSPRSALSCVFDNVSPAIGKIDMMHDWFMMDYEYYFVFSIDESELIKMMGPQFVPLNNYSLTERTIDFKAEVESRRLLFSEQWPKLPDRNNCRVYYRRTGNNIAVVIYGVDSKNCYIAFWGG